MSTAENSNEDKIKDPPDPACKKIESITAEIRCSLCASSIDDPINLGDVYQVDNVICHYYCLLLSSSLIQNGADHEGIYGFLSKDILKEVRRASRLRCTYCKQKGASIGCTVKSCRIMFHLPCGIKNGSMHQFFEQFLSFCSLHRPHQKVASKFIKLLKEDEDAKMCPICYDPVGNNVSNDTLWAPCCRKRWFHRLCLQRQALAQGLYFFKCPMCNNKDKFNLEMKQFGIYIPERDAAWEREPQAFQDLLHTHKTCDARKCQCPDGRSFAQNTGSWRLLRCNACGSQGTHVICSGLKISASSNSWRCSFCARIFNKGEGSTMLDGLESRPPGSLRSVSPSPSTSSSSGTSPSPCTSSGSSTISSSQRRRPTDVEFEQDRKRRKSSSSSSDLDNQEPIKQVQVSLEKIIELVTPAVLKQQVTPEKVKEQFIQEKAKEQVTPDKVQQLVTPRENTPESGSELKLIRDDDDDEIIIVDDDDESDIEVVDVEKHTSALRTYPVSSELLTKDGKTIMVHEFSAEGHSVPLETGRLGAVNMRPASMEEEARPGLSQSGNCPKIYSRKPKKSGSIAHPSTSKDATQLHIPNVGSISKSPSMFTTGSDMNDASTLGIKIGDVRHSDELFSASRKEDAAENTQETTAQPNLSPKVLNIAKKYMIPTQNILIVPLTVDGKTVHQPCIPATCFSESQWAQLSQLRRAQLMKAQQLRLASAKERSRASPPDVVTLE